MLQITRRVDYALIALTHLAVLRGERQSARELAAAYRLSQPLMANVLKGLARANFVRSIRGTKGGYELAEEPGAISVGQVVEALEGPLQLAECVGQQPRDHMRCQLSRTCPVKRSVFKIHLEIRDVLYGYTVADLTRGAELPGEGLPVARSGRHPALKAVTADPDEACDLISGRPS